MIHMPNREQVICPICHDAVDKLVYRFHIDNERWVIEKIKIDHPAWSAEDGICSRCIDYYHVEIIREQRWIPAIGPYFPVKSADDFIILPTGLRLDADPRYTGKGVTICFIDSGFSFHPDLVTSKNRIRTMLDMTGAEPEPVFDSGDIKEQELNAAWHGTMTSVVCAGDGYLSKGLYKGIASGAELVLLKVQDREDKIRTGYIVKALQWVLENHESMGIRIINISLGDDHQGSYKDSEVDQLAELLIAKGIVIVAAVGNEENAPIRPPANSLNVIAIGGIDDGNELKPGDGKAWHSSYGKTMDGLMKPELVAHAIWVAAPILCNTAEQEEAETLHHLLSLSGDSFHQELNRHISKTRMDHSVLVNDDIIQQKELIRRRIQSAKYISPSYMHVDGTSFSAPVVSAVIAQLLEADPLLTPGQVRQILFKTSKRITGIPPERQGFGMVQPRKALLNVLKKESKTMTKESPWVNWQKNSIEFFIYHHHAEQVSVAGSFNQWAKDVLLLIPDHDGLWKIVIPILPAGCYRYKFLVDGRYWQEDLNNPYREPDGFNGFNSLLIIEPN
jgi:serine protease AprX